MFNIFWGTVQAGGLHNEMYSSDSTDDKIYAHDGFSTTILDSFSTPSSLPGGLTNDETNLISSDRSANEIYIHDGFTSTVSSSFSTVASSTYGLAFDGTNLVSVSNNSEKVYIHDGITSSILDSFSTSGTNPIGLTYDYVNDNLLLSDFDEDAIYKYVGTTSTISTSFSVLTDAEAPRGLAFDGTNLIVTGSLDVIAKYTGVSSTIDSTISVPSSDRVGLTWRL